MAAAQMEVCMTMMAPLRQRRRRRCAVAAAAATASNLGADRAPRRLLAGTRVVEGQMAANRFSMVVGA